MVYIHLNIEIGVKNYEYALLLPEVKHYKRENMILREKITKERSLTEIEKKASLNGFVTPAVYYYIVPTRAIDRKTVSGNEEESRDGGFLRRILCGVVGAFSSGLWNHTRVCHP